MATRPFLVVILSRETPFFGDETISRRRFEPRNPFFWRRDHFSSSFLGRKLLFLATRLFLVIIFDRKTPFFGDEPESRHHFKPKNTIFWRRDHFSSSFLGRKLLFLATRLFLVTILRRKLLVFSDETLSRHHFEAKNA
ncbi:hypothetical protein [Caldifermentibacillus hisashii]|uniref:hypothetical protein n=1 Tax=Caldifermentibacillus hisashii TaxID=996558 RepID=UPI002DFCBCB4|nr:hypothetical protein [Caldifermentibacillus hisashii]